MVQGIVLAVLWLFVRGVALNPRAIVTEFLLGLAVGFPVAFLLRRFYTPETRVSHLFRAAPWAFTYLVVFLKELITANVDVSYRVLWPSMPINPSVVEVPLRVESDLAVTTIANSITLTPGTLTMDHDAETNTLYVHAIAGDRDAVLAPIRTWEDYAIRVFDEDADPSDPAPPRPSARASTPDSDESSDDEGGEHGGGGQ